MRAGAHAPTSPSEYSLIISQWPSPLAALGNSAIIACPQTAFLCSRRYPAAAVLPIYDWAREVRERGDCVVSGFHSALERDVLEILLEGSQPLVLVAARSLPQRLPLSLRPALEDGRLLVLSPFSEELTRITVASAGRRNELMLAMAERIVIGHVSEGGQLAGLLSQSKPRGEIIYLTDSRPSRD